MPDAQGSLHSAFVVVDVAVIDVVVVVVVSLQSNNPSMHSPSGMARNRIICSPSISKTHGPHPAIDSYSHCRMVVVLVPVVVVVETVVVVVAVTVVAVTVVAVAVVVSSMHAM